MYVLISLAPLGNKQAPHQHKSISFSTTLIMDCIVYTAKLN